MYTAKERQRYNEDREITCKRLGITKNEYNWLRHKGEELRKLYEDNCNGYFSDETEYYAKTGAIEKVVNAYVKKLGLYIYYQGDPRGVTVYLDKKAIPENNYTSAECIY